MSNHETHSHHGSEPAASPKTSFWPSLAFGIMLVGLFIAAVNFVSVMSHADDDHGHGHASHGTSETTEGHHEAPADAHGH